MMVYEIGHTLALELSWGHPADDFPDEKNSVVTS